MVNQCFGGQIAIVTGASRGIGQAISLDLASKGAKVMILGRDLNSLEEIRGLIEAQGGYAESYVADVTDQSAVEVVVDTIYNKYGQIDILVCNAGNTTMPTFGTQMSMEEFDAVIKTHIYGTMHFVQVCGEKMKEKQYGRIVITGSVAGISGTIGQINYSVAKAGLKGITYTLAKELGPHGITVNILQPGLIETSMTTVPLQLAREKIINDTPVRRIGRVEDVAHATSFLCMKESSFITGVALTIDGGYISNSEMDQLMMQVCSHNAANM